MSVLSGSRLMPPHDSRLCICRACVCGHHHCLNEIDSLPLGGDTTYRVDYPPKYAKRDPLMRPDNALYQARCGPDHFKTTKQETDDALRRCPYDRALPFKPRQGPADQTPFGGNTTYRVDYVPHELGPQDRLGAPPEEWQKGKYPGQYKTTNQDANDAVMDALKDGMPRPTLFKSPDGISVGHLPFGGNTTYRNDYIGHQPDINGREGAPQGDNLFNCPDSRDFLTTHGASYQKYPAEERKPCPSSFVPRRPPSADMHVKVEELPNEFGQFPH